MVLLSANKTLKIMFMVRFMGRAELKLFFILFMLKSLISIFHVFHLFNSLYQSWSMIYEERDEVVSESLRRVRKLALNFTCVSRELSKRTFFYKHKKECTKKNVSKNVLIIK